MYIYEIVKPGTWLVSDSSQRSWEIQSILRNIESLFFDANLALNLFMSSFSREIINISKEQWESDAIRRDQIRKEVETRFSNPFDHKNWDEIHFQTEMIFKREQWRSGRIPPEFENGLAFMHARAFLYSLDLIDKFISVLENMEGTPEKIKKIHQMFTANFPDLRGVRNTTQHLEDRARGLGAGRSPKPLELKAINNRLVKSESGALILNSLNGTKYGNTMADGHYGEVDVSPSSMQILSSLFQEILNCFEWTGPPVHLPSI
ncbi:MAG: hypothetical protein IH597_06335 [Bacteroidales bacterium]|nr:hypothetical protein [Bacteroidales bacterium]